MVVFLFALLASSEVHAGKGGQIRSALEAIEKEIDGAKSGWIAGARTSRPHGCEQDNSPTHSELLARASAALDRMAQDAAREGRATDQERLARVSEAFERRSQQAGSVSDTQALPTGDSAPSSIAQQAAAPSSAALGCAKSDSRLLPWAVLAVGGLVVLGALGFVIRRKMASRSQEPQP
jgi:hypothetical protein